MAKGGDARFIVTVDANNVPKSVEQIKSAKQGVDKLDKSTKKLEKTQTEQYTRQKQGVIQTANSTKNFSKMQQTVDGGGGAGGLVRAYALLAANVFALTAAFGVLSRSAAVDTLIESMEILSTRGGTYIKSIAREMQAASGYAIDLAQAFRQVSLASSAGLSTKEIEGLTQVARGAAVSLGRDLPDAMDRIFRGAIKMEPEILDEIGLFVRVDEAAQIYARSLGKSVSALTLAEKRQGFLNQILDQGTKKFQEYAEAIQPDVYVKLSGALLDLSQSATSVMNKFLLGPIIGFLVENPKILAIAFASLVTFLLSKAIPAIGAFSFSASTAAKEALEEEEKYIKKIKDSLAIEKSAEQQKREEWLESKRVKQKAMMDADKKTKRFPSRAAGAKENLKALKKETDFDKRKVLLADRIGILKKAENTAKGDNLKLIKDEIKEREKELRNMRSQVIAQEDITRLEKEQGLAADKKYLAGKRQQKLEQRVARTTIVAGATGIAETEGMAEGWANLKKGIKEGVTDPVTGATKHVKGFQKGLTYLSGGAQIATVGFQNLMMTLQPFLMALPIITWALVKLGEWLGFNSKEATAFDEALKKLNETLETLDKRIEKQVAGMQNAGLEWIENMKASLAFNKGLFQTTEGVLDVNKKLEEFQKEAKWAARAWEFFKNQLGWGREQEAAEAMLTTLTESFKGFAKQDPELITKIFGTGFEGLAQSTFDLVQNTAKLAGSLSALEIAYEGENLEQYMRDMEGQGKIFTTVADMERRLSRALTDKEKTYFELSKKVRDVNNVEGELQKNSEKHVQWIKNVNKETERQIKLYESLISAYEGAQESIGKFQQAFLPKTKVDEVLASFRQMEASLKAMTNPDDIAAFWKSFKNGTNAFSGIMDELAGELKKVDGGWQKAGFVGPKHEIVISNKQMLEKVRQEFEEYQRTVLTSKQLIQKLAAENKHLDKVLLAGMSTINKKFTNINRLATENLSISKGGFVMAARSFKIEEARAEKVLAHLDTLKDEAAIKDYLMKQNLTEMQALALRGYYFDVQNKQLEEAIAHGTKQENISLQLAKNAQVLWQAQKAVNDQLIKQIELQMKMQRLSTAGTTALTPRQESQLAIKQAEFKLEATIRESEIKRAIIRAEYLLLEAQLEIIGKRQGWSASRIKQEQAFISKAGKLQEQALTLAMSNAALQFREDLADATASAFEGGMFQGVEAAKGGLTARLAQIEEDRQKAVDEAIAKSNAGGGDLGAGISAALEASKPFDDAKDLAAKEYMFTTLRNSVESYAESLKKLGPEGEFVSAVLTGTLAIKDAFDDMQISLDASTTKLGDAAAIAEFAAQALGQISAMMQANSKAQQAEIDNQIKAEERRDGKSKQSLAKIAGMEKKKEAMKKKAFEQNKKMMIAQTIMSTAAGIMSMWSAPDNVTVAQKVIMSGIVAAMGAMQLAVIKKMTYQGGGDVAKPAMTALSIGKRSEKVDVSRGASAGELGYLRGQRGTGRGANFVPTGGAAGLRKGYADGGVLVGERGPEVIAPRGSYEVTPNDALGGPARNINFTINAVDAAGVEEVLLQQRGNIIGMIREAANDTGERFLESVDTDVVGVG